MSLYEKLFNIQHEVEALTKDTKGYNYKYFDINQMLEKLLPKFQEQGLLLIQPIEDDRVTTRIIDLETGEDVQSSIALTIGAKPQDLGSEITYYRRYTLQSLLGLRAEDDDASKTKAPDYKDDKPWLNEGTEAFERAKEALNDCYTISDIRKKYKVNKKVAEALQS